VPAKKSLPDQWDGKAKLATVIQTAVMNEAELSEYCRQHGLYPEQVAAWKAVFEAVGQDDAPANKAALARERNKNKQLERELRRKEKAPAEAAALLTLSRKPRPSRAPTRTIDPA
jgi:transposase-like protein